MKIVITVIITMLLFPLTAIADFEKLSGDAESCRNVAQLIQSTEVCEEKLDIFKENLEHCKTASWLEVDDVNTLHFLEYIFDVGSCFGIKGAIDKEIEVYKLGLSQPDWIIEYTTHGCSAHDTIESTIEAVKRSKIKQCISFEEFQQAVQDFIDTKEIQPLIKYARAEVNFQNGTYPGHSCDYPLSKIVSAIKNSIHQSKLKIDCVEENGIILTGWDGMPSKAYAIGVEKIDDCVYWAGFYEAAYCYKSKKSYK